MPLMRLGFLVALLLLGFQSAAVSADPGRCDAQIVERLGKHFEITNFSYPDAGMYASEENGGLIIAGVCKPWPDDPSRTIATFAFDAGQEYQKGWLVVLYDKDKNEVLASYRSSIEEDAASEVNKYSLGIDTGRYLLSKSSRAFGVRMNTQRWRCTYEAGYGDELTLFAIQGVQLRPVLRETMSHWVFGQGNLCGGEAVNRTEVQISVGVETSSHHGFADLRMIAKPDDGRKPISQVVKYNGTHYDLQPWRAKFGPWWDATVVADVPETALLAAVSSKNQTKVIQLLDSGVELESFDNGQTTPLHAAVAIGDSEMIELLLARGADINTRSSFGDRPLHDAAEAGNLELVQLLLDQGADVNALGYLGLTPLHRAAGKRHKAVVELLLSSGAGVNDYRELRNPPFHYAAMGGDVDIMSLMLQRGADVDARDRHGFTPLHRAALSGGRAAVALLLSREAQIDAKDKQLLTPLHYAVNAGNADVVGLLIERGANPLTRNAERMSPLDQARRSNRPDLIKIVEDSLDSNAEAVGAARAAQVDALVNAAMRGQQGELDRLLNSGVDINETNSYDRTALFQATLMNNLDVVAMLLERGALPLPNSQGTTPLHNAAARGWGALVKILLDAKADPNSQNLDGQTPLYLAILKGYTRAAELLLEQGAEVKFVDIGRNTLLHVAAGNGNDHWIRILISKGLEVNAKNLEGTTPLHRAVTSGKESAVKLLLAHGADPNAADRVDTPLGMAVKQTMSYPQHPELVRLLLASGADVHSKPPHGESVFQRVQSSKNKELIDLFATLEAAAHR